MKFTEQQRRAISMLRQFGRLQRHAGGYWGKPGNGTPSDHVGTPTIQNLYNRRLVDVLCADGSYNWDGHSAPRFAVPTDKLTSAVSGDENLNSATAAI